MSAPSFRPRRSGLPWLAGYYWLLLLLLYLPIGILLLFSFHANATMTFPLRGLTTDWYARVFHTPNALDAVRNSAVVAAGSSALATLLAAMTAVLIARYRFRGKSVLVALAVMPLVVPYLVLAVGLLVLFAALDIPRSLVTVGCAHTVIAFPYALLIIVSRLAGMAPELEEAAMDLGASYPTALRLIVLPIAAPAVVSAWLVAFTASFDEFALALFLTGADPTLPVYIYGQLRFASRLPMMVALAVMVAGASLALAVTANWLRRREPR